MARVRGWGGGREGADPKVQLEGGWGGVGGGGSWRHMQLDVRIETGVDSSPKKPARRNSKVLLSTDITIGSIRARNEHGQTWTDAQFL